MEGSLTRPLYGTCRTALFFSPLFGQVPRGFSWFPHLVDTQMGIIDCNTKHNFKRNSSMLSCFAIDGPYKRRENALFYRINTDSEKARRRAAFYEGYDNHFLSVPPAIGWRFIATRLGWLGLLLRRAHLCKEVRVATKSRE